MEISKKCDLGRTE